MAALALPPAAELDGCGVGKDGAYCCGCGGAGCAEVGQWLLLASAFDVDGVLTVIFADLMRILLAGLRLE